MDKLTSDFLDKLMPHVMGWIQVSIPTVSGTNSGTTTHDIGGDFHTGTLKPSQAPEFALLDGSRIFTGNIRLSAGGLVDGIDVSDFYDQFTGHIIQPHVHHTAFTALRDTNDDLVYPDDSDYAIQIAGDTFVSTIVDPNPLLHKIVITLDHSNNPGATSKLLSSSAAGGLTLQTLSVQGAATVLQDFTVGTNVLFVNESGSRVGINKAPDAQYELDVRGNVHTDSYFIGKQALQIADATFIAHYDGKEPANTDFTGSPLGHKGQTGIISGPIIYRKGKYGKAIQVAAATTNKILNPVAGVDTTNTSVSNTTLTRITNDGVLGLTSYKAVTTNSSSYVQLHTDSSAASTTYALSGYVKGVANQTIQACLFDGATEIGLTTITFTGAWQYFSIVAASGSGATVARLRLKGSINGQTYYATALQLEQKSLATPIALGTLPGHTWGGTAHASTSIRTASRITYTAADVLPEYSAIVEYSLSAWVYIDKPALTLATDRIILDIYSASSGYVRMYRRFSTTDLWIQTNDSVTSAQQVASLAGLTEGWHMITWTYTASVGKVYVDGVLVQSGTAYLPATTWPALLSVGAFNTGASELNSFIDEVLIVARAMSADEILAIYNSNAPVFAETSAWGFYTPTTLAWADERGLFAIDDTGNAVLGVVGVNAHSWGGMSLDKGDILIGRIATNVGSMLWDSSAGTLALTGWLNLALTGGIYQGSGTPSSPTTGIKMWSENVAGTNYGRLGGYTAGVLQWYGHTDGKFYAAAGNLVLDANGVSIITPDLYSGAKAKYRFTRSDAVDYGWIIGYTNTADTAVYGQTQFVTISQATGELAQTDIAATNVFHYATGDTQINLFSSRHNGVSLLPGYIHFLAGNADKFRIASTFTNFYDNLLRMGGTSFPSSPSNNDLFYRTDRDLLYYYDSTLVVWITVHEYTITQADMRIPDGSITAVNITATTDGASQTISLWPLHGTYKTLVTGMWFYLGKSGTHDASNRFIVDVKTFDYSNAAISLCSWNTQTEVGRFEKTYSSVLNTDGTSGSSPNRITIRIYKVGTPGNINLGMQLKYRLVG